MAHEITYIFLVKFWIPSIWVWVPLVQRTKIVGPIVFSSYIPIILLQKNILSFRCQFWSTFIHVKRSMTCTRICVLLLLLCNFMWIHYSCVALPFIPTVIFYTLLMFSAVKTRGVLFENILKQCTRVIRSQKIDNNEDNSKDNSVHDKSWFVKYRGRVVFSALFSLSLRLIVIRYAL